MAFCNLNILRDGHIKASDVEDILSQMAEAIADELSDRDMAIDILRKEVKSLRGEIEAERRLRLSMNRR